MTRDPTHVRRITAAALAAVTLWAASACGGGTSDEPSGEPPAAGSTPAASDPATTSAPSTASSATPTTATATDPTEAERSTTTAPPTTKAPTTTAGPTSTTVELPRPIAPPVDGEAEEPVIPLGRISIPRIGIDRVFYEGIRLPTFDLGPGHWPGTAMPGQVGNIVIGGHRTSKNADFRYIDQLEPGDEVLITAIDGSTFRYLVDSVEITDPYAQRVVAQTPARTATLFACHPPGSVRERILVHLTLAP